MQGSKNQLTQTKFKSMSSCLSDHKDSKNVKFAICPMFRNAVIGQNVKMSLTFALIWSKSDPD